MSSGCRTQKSLPILLAGFLTLLLPLSAHASNLTDLLERESSTLAFLERLARKVMQTERELYELDKQKQQLAYQVREAQRRSMALDRRARKQRRDIRLRIRHLYKTSRGGFARLMLNTTEGRNLFSRMSAAALILERDIREIRLYKKELRLQLSQKQRLQRQQDQQARLELRLSRTLEVQQKAQREQYQVLWFLRRNRRYRMKLQEELNRQQRALLKRVAYLNVMVSRARGFQRLKGRLAYPVFGSIVGRFGSLSDSTRGVSVLRNGLTFRTYRRGRVRAVARGLVRVAEPMEGYGNLVLMEHTGGFFTIYGFLSSMRVRPGQLLYGGTTLGNVGLDPLDGRPALYFEIRRGEYPEDPTHWFRRHATKK